MLIEQVCGASLLSARKQTLSPVVRFHSHSASRKPPQWLSSVPPFGPSRKDRPTAVKSPLTRPIRQWKRWAVSAFRNSYDVTRTGPHTHNALADEPQLVREIATWCIIANAYDTKKLTILSPSSHTSGVAGSRRESNHAWPQPSPCRGRSRKSPTYPRKRDTHFAVLMGPLSDPFAGGSGQLAAAPTTSTRSLY